MNDESGGQTPTAVIRGSEVRAFLWAGSILYTGCAVTALLTDWSILHYLGGTLMGALAADLGILALFTFLAGTGVAADAYGVTTTQEGVEIRGRFFPFPIFAGRGMYSVKWKELHDVSIWMGSVQIKTDNPWTWLHLNCAQARGVLTDQRCPIRHHVSPEIARKLGLPNTEPPGSQPS
jgi:hypothetical protein